MAVMPSKPGGAQLALTAGAQGSGIYYIVKPALSERARKQWKRLVNRKDHDKIIINLGNILEKPVHTARHAGECSSMLVWRDSLSAVRAV